jgi:hypothetical protein
VVSATDTRTQIEQAVRRFEEEVPALGRLKLVMRLELLARGDVPTWRVELPGPSVSKDPARDARVDVSVARPAFNELAREGRLEDWVRAYERGQIKVSGDSGVVRLVGSVIERQRQRARSR